MDRAEEIVRQYHEEPNVWLCAQKLRDEPPADEVALSEPPSLTELGWTTPTFVLGLSA